MEMSLGAGLAVTRPAVEPVMDPESRAWVAALAGEGGDREAALDRLQALLLRAARFELARLGDFRGLSRFTTWAYKFALLEAATKARRLAWRDRELPEDWVALADPDGRPAGGGGGAPAMSFIDGLLGPQEPELGCDDCFAELDRYVELELAGEDPDAHLRAHLAGCLACREEHESLRALLAEDG
jgi:hypothetical protein